MDGKDHRDSKKGSEKHSEESPQSRASDLVKKALTVGLGAIFLTEESLRSLVSEIKLPKELIAGILDSANKTKNEFLGRLSSDVLERLASRVDPKALLDEIFAKNEIELQMKIRLKRRKDSGHTEGTDGDDSTEKESEN